MPHSYERDWSCPNFHLAARLNRRDILTVGSLCGLELFLPGLLRAKAKAEPKHGTFGQAKSVIMLFLNGGHAQQETFDPKPNAPSEARGQFGATRTSVPGVQFGELLPQSAKIMHKLTLVRALNHLHPDHVQASLPAMTGHHHPLTDDLKDDPPPSPHDFPPIGAVLSQLRPAGKLPTWVQVGPLMRRNNGTVLHGQLPGFLGPRYGSFTVDQDFRMDNVKIEAVSPKPGLSIGRLAERRELLQQIDIQRGLLDVAAEVQSFDAFHAKAFDLVSSAATAKAFDLAAEPATVRDRYGRTQFGQCCLLARRLAEAGVPMINVHYCRTPVGSWDTHSRHFPQMKNSLCPTFDQAFTSLVNDLDQRGLLDQTLVIANAEFGRTPKVNKNGGRDHWPRVYSIAMAGGGVAGGVVHGSSDRLASVPNSHPHDPADVAATIYHLLGVPPETTVSDQGRRPHSLIIGQRIDGVLV